MESAIELGNVIDSKMPEGRYSFPQRRVIVLNGLAQLQRKTRAGGDGGGVDDMEEGQTVRRRKSVRSERAFRGRRCLKWMTLEWVRCPVRGRGGDRERSRSLFQEAGLSRRIGGSVSGGLPGFSELRVDGGD